MFFGTPQWAVPSLEALIASDIDVAAVVTNPDRPAGRGMQMKPSPVKSAAEAAGLPVLQPAKARDPEFIASIVELDVDVATVVAYGKILPGDLLAVPKHGFVNVHFSLLPAYRGAAPVQRSLMNGDRVTGISIMVLTEGMDEGPVLATEEIEVLDGESAGALGDRMATVGAELLVDTLPRYLSGELEPREQDHDRATYAPKITEEEARIDWSRPAAEIETHIRGLDPAPGAWTALGDKRLKVWRAKPDPGERMPAGRIGLGPRLVVGTGTDPLELVEVQLAGKKRMGGEGLLRGLHLDAGAQFR